MRTSSTPWAVAVTAAIAIGTVTWAASTGEPAPSATAAPASIDLTASGLDPHFLDGPVAVALGITDAQRQQIRAILRDALPTLKPLVESIMRERQALRTAIQRSPIDETAIRAQSAKVAAVEADIAVERARLFQKIQPVLTPEQLQRIHEIEASMHKKIGGKLARFGKWLEGSHGL